MSKDAWNPEQYHKFQHERTQPFFDLFALVKHVPDMDVVDLGCGSGELTQVLHNLLKAQSTLGIDNSPAMLEKAKVYTAPGLTFANQTIEAFAEKNRYDLVFSNAAIHWCPDHKKIFKRICESLKPNGQIAIQMPANHDYHTHLIAYALGNEEPYKSILVKPQTSFMLGIGTYASTMYELGFREPMARVNVYGHILDSREGVIEWVKGSLLTYYESRLPSEMYQDFLKEYRKRLFAILKDTKPFYYPFKRILLWGQLS